MMQLPNENITVDEISCFESFLDLRDEWHVLEASIERSSVFITHSWLSSAWQWRCRDSSLFVLVVRRNGKIIGACPFLKSTAARSLFRYTKLEYLAIPDSQECYVLATASLEAEVHKAIFAYLAGRKDWDVIEIEHIPDDTFTAEVLLSQTSGLGIAVRDRCGGTNPSVQLSGTWQDYYARRSRRLKKGNNHTANKLKRRYSEVSVEFHFYSTWSEGQVNEAYRNLVEMSVRSWKSHETRSSFDHDGPRAWLESITTGAAEEGWLAVWVLKLDGECAATEMQLIRDGVVSALRADFDNELRDLSPGTYLNWKILERLFSRDLGDIRQYRMGPGANPYKARWSEQEPQLGHVVLYNNTNRSRLVRLFDEAIKPALRFSAKLLSPREK